MNIISAKELRILTKRSSLISYFNKVVSDAASSGETACAVALPGSDSDEYEYLLTALDESGYLFELYYEGSGISDPAGIVVCWDNDARSLEEIFANNDEICRE